MKTPQPPIPAPPPPLGFRLRPSRRRAPRGFSLIVALMMMVLLTTIALGLLSLSTISLRSSSQSSAQAIARANARLALMTAIGDLQKNLGPDTRVSAPASQNATLPAQPRWVAAYTTLNPSNSLPAVGHMAGGSTQQWATDARANNTNWRDSYRLGWLVSQVPGVVATPANPGSDLVTLAEIPTAAVSEKIRAPRVSIVDSNSRKIGTYAYWVGDESTKARLDQLDPRATGKTTLAVNEQTHSMLLAQRANAAKTTGYDWQSTMTADTSAKLVSTSNMALPATDKTAAAKNASSFTVHSMGVLSDPVTGGLKLDLAAYLDNTGSTDPYIDLRSIGRGVLSDSVSFVPGLRYSQTGASYGSLRGWRRLGLDASGTNLNPTSVSIEPRFPANRATSRSGGQVREGYGVDNDTGTRTLVSRSSGSTEIGAPIHPIIADARFSVDFVYDNTASPPRILPLIYPRVKLWNPYNATLRAANYVVVMPFRTNGADFSIGGNAPAVSINLSTLLANSGLSDTAMRSFVFTVPAATFGPGECKVFMPDVGAAGASGLPRGGGSPYAIRYDHANISGNKLTAGLDNTPNSAFFLDSTAASSTVAAAITTGATKPNIKCTTTQHTFMGEGWFLKGALASTSVSAATVLDSSGGSKFPTLQSVYTGIRGIDSYSGGTTDEWEWTWDVAQRELFAQSDGRLAGNVYAPAQWSRHLRFLYINEAATKFNNLDRTASGYWYTAALGSDWNPRANVTVRFPSTPSSSWYWRFRHPFLNPIERETSAVLAAGTAASGTSYVASPFWSESASAHRANRFCLFDVQPSSVPLLSVARLRHAALSPFAWQPAYPIGSSRSPFFADSASTVMAEIASRTSTQQWQAMKADGASTTNMQDIVGTAAVGADQMLVYDIAFEANSALFDRYFMSGLPRTSAGRTNWNGTTALANSRLLRIPEVIPGTPTTVIKTVADEASKPAAMFLQIGSFNVNSTDVEAWKAVISGLRDTTRATAAGDAKSKHPYSRNLAPFMADGPDSTGTSDPGPYASSNFSGLPDLDDTEIAALASAIVDEVKLRGPFLSLSDFVNRRLAPDQSTGPDRTALYGALDSAIAATSINGASQNSAVAQPGLVSGSTDGFGSSTMTVDYRHMSPSRNSGMPGSLTQGDLLEPLAPILTARGDTFVIRAYGDARDTSGNILARAWCEAVVQRLPQYLQHLNPSQFGTGNEPAVPALTETWSTGATGKPYATGAVVANSALTQVNKTFGRRLQINAFRWLSPNDLRS